MEEHGTEKVFPDRQDPHPPEGPNTVYVGALGRLYGPSQERGLFKTTDGGTTWKKVLFVDDKTGVIDMRMDPADRNAAGGDVERARRLRQPPRRAAVRERLRRQRPFSNGAAGAGIYKTTDGGKTFKKLSQGLPAGPLGRIGLDWYRKDPKVVFAIIESEKIAMGKGAKPVGNGYIGIAGRTEKGKTELLVVAPESPAHKAGLKVGDLLMAVDGQPVATYADLLERMGESAVGDKLKLKIGRGSEQLDVELVIGERPAAGRA